MKLKKSLFIFIFLNLFLISLPKNIFANENESTPPYEITFEKFSDKDESLYFHIKNADYNIDSVIAIVNGKKYTADLLNINSNNRNELYFGKKFNAGTNIKLYVNYFLDDDTSDEIEAITFLTSLEVIDTSGPKIKVSDFSIRSTKIEINTNEKSKIEAVYNNKKLTPKKINDKKWTLSIKKPLLNKKLIITATDSLGNKSKINISPKNQKISIIDADIIVGDTLYTGYALGSLNSDKAILKIKGKSYTASIKSKAFDIKIPKNMPSPTTAKLYIKDKFGNTLKTSNVRVYKYTSLKIGMTKAQVLNSHYGEPDKKESDTYPGQKWDHWVYEKNSKTIYLNFLNGKLFSISKY